MIEYIILENFQCHKFLKVELGRITVLSGPNGVGKSAFLRALKWLCLNVWDGRADEIITWGESWSRVTLGVDEREIVREKGKDLNLYTMDGQEYAAFRTSVPEPVAQVLQIGPDNFQDQMDLPFWMLLTPGNAAQALNEIYSLSLIDSSLGVVGSELRQARASHESLFQEVEELRSEVLDLNWVKYADSELQELERVFRLLEESTSEIDRIRNQLTQLEDWTRQVQELDEVQQHAAELVSLAESIENLEAQIALIESMLEMEDELVCLEKERKTKQAKLNKIMRGKCPLCLRGPS